MKGLVERDGFRRYLGDTNLEKKTAISHTEDSFASIPVLHELFSHWKALAEHPFRGITTVGLDLQCAKQGYSKADIFVVAGHIASNLVNLHYSLARAGKNFGKYAS